MLLTIFISVLFFLSDTPFCCGVYDAVSCLLMPCKQKYPLNEMDVNSCPLPGSDTCNQATRFSFNQCFKSFENFKGIRLFYQKINSYFPTKIICKGDKVLVSSNRFKLN